MSDSTTTTDRLVPEIPDAPSEERVTGNDARRRILRQIVQLILILLVLLLIATVSGRGLSIIFPGLGGLTGDLQNQLGTQNTTDGEESQGSGNSLNDISPYPSTATPTPDVAGVFRTFYDANGGERIFGKPISQELTVNGRTIQWFERTRLEVWPELSGTSYYIQSGRVGEEFTTGVIFLQRVFFVSEPGARYFPETGHGVEGEFLSFWENNGGLQIFGFPISEAIQERLPDGNIYTVQYFERARLELHSNLQNTPYIVQVGLLGRGLYLNESKPEIIATPQAGS